MGQPDRVRGDYKRIAAYAPYDNVAAKPYPALLALAGLTDPRVTYWEPAKWVAKLREHTTGSEPILLKTNMAPATAVHRDASSARGNRAGICVLRSRLRARCEGLRSRTVNCS